ncbi:MAG: thermonuclease family protein [Betaproteobacteria bacterium]|nr:thermonuclease family protein [Betaproteobacteria bacterium]
MFAAAVLVAAGGRAEELTGTVVSVHEGDTLTVLADCGEVRIRLADIDAPELKQPFGEQSRQSLAELCLDKDVVVRKLRQDRYGRTLGRVHCAGTEANIEQVRRGMAWVFQRHPHTASPLFFSQDAAQRARDGLWADESPVAPWVWRRLPRAAPKAKKPRQRLT